MKKAGGEGGPDRRRREEGKGIKKIIHHNMQSRMNWSYGGRGREGKKERRRKNELKKKKKT